MDKSLRRRMTTRTHLMTRITTRTLYGWTSWGNGAEDLHGCTASGNGTNTSGRSLLCGTRFLGHTGQSGIGQSRTHIGTSPTGLSASRRFRSMNAITVGVDGGWAEHQVDRSRPAAANPLGSRLVGGIWRHRHCIVVGHSRCTEVCIVCKWA